MNLPIYNAYIASEEDGLFVMSLVENPATEKNWICFNKDEKIEYKFSIENEEEHILMGVVMLADTPIYRVDGDYEYFLKFSKETLKEMAQKMLFDNTVNNIDLNHNGNILEKGSVIIRELFIKDVERGIDPKGFEDVADGSLLCTYKIYDEDLWQSCKDGTFQGFSLEGVFSIKKETFNKTNKKNNMISKFKSALKELLVKFGSIQTDKGEIEYEGDMLEVGTLVEAEDGDYTAEDGTVYTIKDGKVEAITPMEEDTTEEVEEMVEEETTEEPTEEETVEEPTEEETVEEEPTNEEVDEVKAQLEELKVAIETLKAEIDELKKLPSADCVVEDFEKAVKVEDSVLSKSQKATIEAIKSAFGK